MIASLLRPGRNRRLSHRPLRLACVLLASIQVHAASAQGIRLPPVTRFALPNGMRVISMEYHRAPTLVLTAIFPGGASGSPPEKAGLAGLTSELLRKGTEKRTAQQIAEEIDFLGGSLDTGAGDDRLSVSLSVLAKDANAGLDLFADAILHPTFPTEELERARQLALAGLDSLTQDPGEVVSRVATQTVFAGHPYGQEPTLTSIRAITRDDVLAYYRRFVVPDRAILVAVGDFRTPDMLGRLRARFGDWPHAGAIPSPAAPVQPGPRKLVLIDKPDATQTQARLVRTAFARSSKDYFPAVVADSILGGGFTSRLVDEVRVNRHLTYGISSSFSPRLRGGSFAVGTFSKIETTRALISAVDQILTRTASGGFTAQELSKVKGYLAGLYAIRMQTPEALAGELADIEFYGLPQDYLRTYILRIRSVTLAETNRIARSYFAPQFLSIVLVAPAAKVAAQVRPLGTFETRPIASVIR